MICNLNAVLYLKTSFLQFSSYVLSALFHFPIIPFIFLWTCWKFKSKPVQTAEITPNNKNKIKTEFYNTESYL